MSSSSRTARRRSGGSRPAAKAGPDIVVEEGLKGGEQVIVEGLQSVRPGAPVHASPAPPPLSGS